MGVPQTVHQSRSRTRPSNPTTTSPAGRSQEDQEKERYNTQNLVFFMNFFYLKILLLSLSEKKIWKFHCYISFCFE